MGIRMTSADLEWLESKEAAASEANRTLTHLTNQERIQIFMFPWVISLVIFVLSLQAPSSLVKWIGLLGSTMLAVSPLLFMTGMRKRHVVHLTATVCCLCACAIAWYSGGILSAQLAWLILLPMMPLRLVSIRAGVFWLMISLVIFAVFGWLHHHGIGHVADHASAEYFNWTIWQRIFLGLCMLSLPWYYTNLYSKSIELLKHQNKLIRQKKHELQQAKVSKKKFISRLSHEMRTPMNAIIGFSHLLQSQTDNDESVASVIRHIESTSQHLLALINGIMDYSLLLDGRLKISKELVDVNAFIAQTTKMFEQRVRSMQIDYACLLPADQPSMAMLDAPRLRLVLMYLIEHALERTCQGHVHLKVQHSSDHVVCFLEYSGLVLTAEDLAVFNEPNSTYRIIATQYADAAARMGLRMATALAQMMGGELLAYNHSHAVGVSVRLTLPVQWQSSPFHALTKATQPCLDAGQSVMPSSSVIHVLIVDDNPVNRLLVNQVIMSEWPHAQVVQAENGKKALAVLDTQAFDIVLMDMLMPEMDGIEATGVLRHSVDRINRHVPILGLTANISTDDHIRCIKAGMNDVVLKPFDKEKLAKRVHQLLESNRQQAPVPVTDPAT